MTKLYVASSWRNPIYPGVIQSLREAGHECYDFRNPEGGTGFGWSQIDEHWKNWSLGQYAEALKHEIAGAGFHSDFDAMKWAEQLVLVLPSGRSAHVEAGWAAGANKKVHVYIPEELPGSWEPELMYLCFTSISKDIAGLLYMLEKHRPNPSLAHATIYNQQMASAEGMLGVTDLLAFSGCHDWVPSKLGHGNTMCAKCMITDLEAKAIGRYDYCEANIA